MELRKTSIKGGNSIVQLPFLQLRLYMRKTKTLKPFFHENIHVLNWTISNA